MENVTLSPALSALSSSSTSSYVRCGHKFQWSIEDTQLKWARHQGKLARGLVWGPKRAARLVKPGSRESFPGIGAVNG